MKKVLLFIMTGILLVSVMGFALGALDEEGNPIEAPEEGVAITAVPYGAEQGNQGEDASENANQGNQGEDSGMDEETIGLDENESQEEAGNQEHFTSKEFQNSQGKTFRVQSRESGEKEIESQGVKARTHLNFMSEGEESEAMLKATLSNGKNAEVKVMPDAASETALEKLKLHNCVEEQGCFIELIEVRQQKEVGLAYKIRTQRTSKVLGLFQKDMDVEAQVDAETGEIIKVRKPWWAFLATQPQE